MLGLEAFRMGPRPILALDFSSWYDAAPGGDGIGDEIGEALRGALARLAPLAAGN